MASTSEKYTITLSQHTTVHNVTVTWDSLKQQPEDQHDHQPLPLRTAPEPSQPPDEMQDYKDELPDYAASLFM